MRQVWISRAGAPEVLEVREAADPTPAPGEVRIRVEAAGINFADIMARMGTYPDLPGIPIVVGYEVAGVVDAIGDGVDARWRDRPVFALTRFGGYSDVVCVPTVQVFERPDTLSPLEAATIPVNYLTAYQLVIAMGGLRADETVLVHSAGGGVGIAVVQLAKHIGARVIGTASQGKHAFLTDMGVDHLIDYRTEDFERRVLEITDGRGVELVLDPIGGDSFKKGYRVLAPTGRLGMFGASVSSTSKTRSIWSLLRLLFTMPWLQFNPLALMNDNKGAFGVNMGRMWSEAERLHRWGDELLTLHAAGVVKPHVDRTFRFDDAANAHHYIQDRKNRGKVLLVP